MNIITLEKEARSVLWETLKSCFITYNNAIAFLFGGFFVLWQTFTDNIYLKFVYGSIVYLLFFIPFFIYKSLISLSLFLASKQKINPYGEAIIKLGAGFNIIHQLDRSGKSDFDYILKMLEMFCSQIKQAFDILTTSTCSVSIKIHVGDSGNNDDFRVITLCRDTNATLSNTREPRKTGTKHLISENSCYQHFYINVGKKKGKYYINQNIVMDFEYKNTSFKWFEGEKPNSKDEKVRNSEWVLPYKSELVLPIKLLEDNDNSSLIGYLCIDFPEPNLINENYDAPMAIGIAEGIYDILLKHKNLGTFNN